MNLSRVSVAVLLLALWVSVCAESSDFRFTVLEKVNAINARNCGKLQMLYTHDAVVEDPTQEPVVGRDNIIAQCEGFLPMLETFRIHVEEMTITGRSALMKWLWIGVTADNCLFHLDGYTVYSVSEDDRIVREQDFFSVEQMQRRLFCHSTIEELPSPEEQAKLDAPETQQKLGAPEKVNELEAGARTEAIE